MNMMEWTKTMMNYQQSCLEVNAQPVLVTFARSVGRTFTVTVDKLQLQEQKPATRAQSMKVTGAFWGPISVVATVNVAAKVHLYMDGKRAPIKAGGTIAAVKTVEVSEVAVRYK